MNIYDVHTVEIDKVDGSDSRVVGEQLSSLFKPVVFTNLGKQTGGVETWSLEFLERMDTEVPAQKPESDGVNYFVKFFRLPMKEFIQRIRAGEDLYIGAREILGRQGNPSNKHGLKALADLMPVPGFIDKQRIWSSNLWVGAGSNNTLLHYDPWDSYQILASGSKEFLIFPPEESSKMHQYSPLNFRALRQGRVLHSKIRPLDVQPKYAEDVATTKGWRAELESGDMIAIPAGYWHFVRSEGENIGVNYFVKTCDKKAFLREPLRSYWIKENITLLPVRLYKWPIRIYNKLRRFFERIRQAYAQQSRKQVKNGKT